MESDPSLLSLDPLEFFAAPSHHPGPVISPIESGKFRSGKSTGFFIDYRLQMQSSFQFEKAFIVRRYRETASKKEFKTRKFTRGGGKFFACCRAMFAGGRLRLYKCEFAITSMIEKRIDKLLIQKDSRESLAGKARLAFA